jgi:sugar-specific transcriptional regulator TrmB
MAYTITNMTDLIELIKNSGMTEKESKIYLATLELGEGTIQEISKKSGVVRTSLYYIVERLVREGFLIETKRNRKNFYMACPPVDMAIKLRQRIREFESHLDILEARRGSLFKRPRMYFLHGPSGFKETWNIIFKSDPREYCIITEGLNFLDYVKAKYIVTEIISQKKKLGVRSKQMIVDSTYAREHILPKDKLENRKSRLLPQGMRLGFTEVICPKLVAFISPKYNDSIFIIEDASFAETRKVLFDQLWYTLPEFG